MGLIGLARHSVPTPALPFDHADTVLAGRVVSGEFIQHQPGDNLARLKYEVPAVQEEGRRKIEWPSGVSRDGVGSLVP
jgi:hypothetical protein